MAALTNKAIAYAKTVYMTAKTYGGYNDTTCKLIAAQAGHESQYFTSALFQRSNNCVGMTKAKVRPHTHQLQQGAGGQPDGNGVYAAYANVSDCIKDLCDYLKYNRFDESKIKSVSQYATWLQSKGYYRDSYTNYLSGVARALQSLNPFLVFAPLTGFFLLLIVSYFLININK